MGIEGHKGVHNRCQTCDEIVEIEELRRKQTGVCCDQSYETERRKGHHEEADNPG